MWDSAFSLCIIDVGCGAAERPVSDILLAVSAVPARGDRCGSVCREIVMMDRASSGSPIKEGVESDRWP